MRYYRTFSPRASPSEATGDWTVATLLRASPSQARPVACLMRRRPVRA